MYTVDPLTSMSSIDSLNHPTKARSGYRSSPDPDALFKLLHAAMQLLSLNKLCIRCYLKQILSSFQNTDLFLFDISNYKNNLEV